jgi:DNA-binding Lrp family transcriptional regulator
MVPPSPASRAVGTAWDDPQIWAITRESLGFIRDNVLITRGDGDLLDELIFTTALDANMAPVNRDPDLQVAYGGVENSAPNELRRAVSINAVAQSLRLPFETVRRRVQRLATSGRCVIGRQGVIVPREAVVTPAYIAMQRARYDRAHAFYLALKAMGALPAAGPGEASAAAPDEPLVRVANRAVSEYVLRTCAGLVALTDNVVSSLVLLELLLANTRAVTAEELPAWRKDPEAAGRPTRIAGIAGPLRLSRETVRRHLQALEEMGFCRRGSGGLIAVASGAARPLLAREVEANQANLRRLFERLRQFGILAAWDDPPPG